ncbi:acetyl-CoA carboxylase biotin carboxyl carrier protein [Streptococcus sobrinus]|uniref:acetyl-CoA carboxylase biotin carboxyl carrier protein n=1 Tax=Streptococcus sobrinus TaxID=1310 RepID=UPI000300F61A|nr:acetyl-CoA carboxylase biotin carboxyl carrier protein [Streptococcus sobrinus]
MNISEIKDLMTQFDGSSLREFAYNNNGESLVLSKNDAKPASPVAAPAPAPAPVAEVVSAPVAAPVSSEAVAESSPAPALAAEGDLVESPLVGVAYLASAPDKPAFVSVGDSVKKGQTLLIIEAMKVMNEVPAPKDGVVTEILVDNEEVVEFGKGLVRIK